MRLLRALLVLLVLVGAGPLLAGPASAHTHPTPTELVSPAVVRVETYGQVQVSLIEHNQAGPHIGLLQRTYRPLLAAGSGFAVDPSGGIVTTPDAIDVDLRRAEIYAVNQIFAEKYGIEVPDDPFSEQTVSGTAPGRAVNERLQRCYEPNTTDTTGGCVVFSSRVVRVQPFVTSQEQYGNLAAEVLAPASGSDGDVAVLRVGASSMPTVELAGNGEKVEAFSVAGFVDTPAGADSIALVDGHFSSAGATDVLAEDVPALADGLARGVRGGPVVGERGEVIGILARTGDGYALVGPEQVRAVLKDAGIEPRRGPVDAVFESGMHNYKNSLYSAAAPSFEQTLQLYPGHTIAAANLADSNAKKGTAADAGNAAPTGATGGSGPSGQGLDLAGAALPLGIVLLLVAGLWGLMLVLRRRQAATATAGAATPPAPAAPSPSAPSPDPSPAPSSHGYLPPTPRAEPTPSPAAAPAPATAPTPAPTSTSGGSRARHARQDVPHDTPLPRRQPAEGASEVSARTCLRCGRVASAGELFCSYCHQPLRRRSDT